MLGLVQVITRFGALGLVAVLGLLSVPSVLLASLSGDAVGLAVLAVAARHPVAIGKELAIPSADLARRIARAAPMLTASQAVIMLQSRADWLLVAAFTSYAALANYSIANKAVELLVLIGSVFGRNALPWFVDGWGSRNLTRVLRLLAVGVSVLSLGLAIAGPGLLHLAFGNKYAGANPVIPILAALGPALVLYQVVQFAALGKLRTVDTVISGGAAVVAQIAVDLIAIPRIGILGAALGMCAFAGVGYPILLLLAVRNKVITSSLAREFAVSAAAVPAVLLAAAVLMRV
jgi:O-antigen/teichoic acid export membrane protein